MQVGPCARDAAWRKLTFQTDTVSDAEFDELFFHPGLTTKKTAVDDISWDDLAVSDGVFGDCSGTGDCIRGRFFDDHDGTAAASVGGVFRKGSLFGAFGADLN